MQHSFNSMKKRVHYNKISMEHNNDIILSVLKFICGENNHLCRLCLCSTEAQEISIYDYIKITRSYYNETLSLLTILTALGVPSDTLLPQVLCSNCATTAINCYLFKKLCIYSDVQWKQAIQILDKGISQTKVLNTRIQSAYFIINADENVILTSHKRCSLKTKKLALFQIRENLKNRLKYLQNQDNTQNNQRVTEAVCEKCGESFNSRNSLSKHIRVHRKKMCPCSVCPKIFSTPSLLQEHTERVHYPKKIRCDECQKMFSTNKMLRIHKHSNHIAVSCKICNINFVSRIELKTHLNKHNINSCPRCKKKFRNKQSYKVHVQICNNNDKTPTYICDICNKGYMHKNSIRTHMKIDHGCGDVLSCDWCNKKFDAISKLKDHIVKHTRERNFTCEQCGGKFVTRPALLYHTRLHTGERPFQCDRCDESFLSSSRRMAHIRRKHLEPTYECNICHIKFVTGHQLKKHKKRHANPHSKLYVDEFTTTDG